MLKINEDFKQTTKAMSEAAALNKDSNVGASVHNLFQKLLAITEADYSVKGRPFAVAGIVLGAKTNYANLQITLEEISRKISSVEPESLTQKDIDASKLARNYLDAVIQNKDEWLDIIPKSSNDFPTVVKRWAKKNLGDNPRADTVRKLETIKSSFDTIAEKTATAAPDQQSRKG